MNEHLPKVFTKLDCKFLDENVVAKKAYEKMGFKGHMLEMPLGI